MLGEEKEEEKKGEEEAGRLKEGPVFTPPWVKPADVKKDAERKEDVAHLLEEEHEHPSHKHTHHEEHRQMTPEEIKAAEKRRRIFSKLQYYLMEYSPYILLIVIVAAIFVGAIFLGLSKLLS
jgi:hypothetical protein